MRTFNIVDNKTCKLFVEVNDDQSITVTENNLFVDAEDYVYKNIQIDVIKQIIFSNETKINYKRHTVLFIILAAITLIASLIYSIIASFGNFQLIITIVLLIISVFFVLLSFVHFPYKEKQTLFSITTEQNTSLFTSYNEEYDLNEIVKLTEYVNSLKI